MPHIRNGSPSPTSQPRTVRLDFTASDAFRKRPRFAVSESEPIVSRVDDRLSIPTRPSSTSAANKRRISNPLPSISRSIFQSDDNAVFAQVPRPRAISAQLRLPAPGSPPSNRPRSPGQPYQLPVSESSRLVDIKLREKLREPLKNDTRGVIYILRDDARPYLGHKIGWTKRPDYRARINEHRKDCKFEPHIVHTVSDVHCGHRVEQLIHADLMDRRREWPCTGHKTGHVSMHQEWFDVSEEVARDTVEKWATFMNSQQPYGWRGNLYAPWRHLLRTRELTGLDNLDHDTRREQWKYVLSPPTYFEYFHFISDLFWHTWHALLSIVLRLWPFAWQMLCLTYSFITFVEHRNTIASSAFALVSVFASCSIVRHTSLPLKKGARGLKGR
jgi:hypothetical protein